MQSSEIEKAFHRAVHLSFSKKKLLLTFPTLLLCGLFVVFGRAVAYEVSGWMAMSFIFLPFLFSSGILLALGVLLIRVHHHEVKQFTLRVRDLLGTSMDLMVGTAYVSLLPVAIYLLFWMGMGFFLLLQSIPGLGDALGVLLAFGPFLFILGSFLLCFFNLMLLFFVAPMTALNGVKKESFFQRIVAVWGKKILSAWVYFLIALFPLLFSFIFLSLAGVVTGTHFLSAKGALSVALEWFFMMIPFAAFLSPSVVFFFVFAAESYQMVQGLTVSDAHI